MLLRKYQIDGELVRQLWQTGSITD